MSNFVHKRAWVMGRAVAYCTAASGGPQPTSTDDRGKVNCPRCKSIMKGNG